MERSITGRTGRAESRIAVEDISRAIREMELLVIVLVLLFYVMRNPEPDSSLQVLVATILFSASVLVINYGVQYRGRWLLAIETWLMIGFITWVLYYSSPESSVAMALYLVPVMMTALTLGRAITGLQVCLAGSCYILVTGNVDAALFSLPGLGRLVIEAAPIVLVAYFTGLLCSDITGAMTRIRIAATTDELTGAYNVRAFKVISKLEFEEANRRKQAVSILMIDVDHLKETNDKFGHPAGDQLIKAVANAISGVVRASDVVARYGGDEFVVLLPTADAMSAELVALRVRARLTRVALTLDDATVPAAVSIGIATYPEDGKTLRAVIKCADEALYESKANGRDRITAYRAVRKPTTADAPSDEAAAA
jgi:diguanylate cyclase (GGDEF)-like protein